MHIDLALIALVNLKPSLITQLARFAHNELAIAIPYDIDLALRRRFIPRLSGRLLLLDHGSLLLLRLLFLLQVVIRQIKAKR